MKRAYITLTLVAALIGLLSSFVGPIAFIQEQKLLIPKPYTVGFSEEEVNLLQQHILEELALHSAYTLVTPEQFEDFATTRDIEIQRSPNGTISIAEYARVADIFGVGRVMSPLVTKSSNGRVQASLTLRDSSQNLVVMTLRADAISLEDFIAGKLLAVDGWDAYNRSLNLDTELPLARQIPNPGTGLSFFAILVIAFYLLHILAASFFIRVNLFTTSPLDAIRESLTQPALGWRARRRKILNPPAQPGLGEAARWTSDQGLRFHPERSGQQAFEGPAQIRLPRFRNPDWIVEFLLSFGILLFAFAWVYADNANLDYVKRFIAETGGIQLAENVDLARQEALLRFLPLLIINFLAYIFIRCLPRLLPRVWANRHLIKGEDDSHSKGWKAFWQRRIAPFLQNLLRAFRLPRPDHTQLEAWLVKVSRSYSRDVAGVRSLWVWVCSYRLPLTLLSAALFALAMPSQAAVAGIPILGWIALVPLFLVIKTCSFTETVFYLTVFGALESLLVNYWHSTYGLIALPFVTIISAFQFFVFGIVMGIIRNLIYSPRVLGRHDWILWPLSWVLFDYLRSLGYAGYPWGFLGVSQYSLLPVIQISELFGIWGVTFLLVLANSVISHVALPYPTMRTPWNNKMRIPFTARRRFPAILSFVMIAAALIFGYLRLSQVESSLYSGPTVALVQPNTDPRKAAPSETMEVLMRLTRETLEENPQVSMVLWPEGALPYDLSRRSPQFYPSAVNELIEFLDEKQVTLLTGTNNRREVSELPAEQARRFHASTPVLEAVGYDGAAERLPNFNSVLLMNPGAPLDEYYEKIRLVPFTEHFPFKEEFPWLYGLLDQFNISDWSEGWVYHLFSTPTGLVATPICFEDVFPDHVRRFVQGGAAVLAVHSNDYWSLTPVEAQQHTAHALFRSVENRRPMIRSTASGLTVFISPSGRIVGETLPYYEEGVLVNRIPMISSPPTLYTLWGDWFPLGCGAIFILICLWVLAFRTNELLFGRRS